MKRLLLKRLLLFPAVLVAALLVILLLGRAPSNYSIEEECRRVQYERRHRTTLLRHELARLESKRRSGDIVENDIMRVTAELHETLDKPRQADLGGWEVLVLPPGAGKPDPAGWYVWGEFDASEESDDISVRGAYLVWLRPTGRLARLAVRIGLAP